MPRNRLAAAQRATVRTPRRRLIRHVWAGLLFLLILWLAWPTPAFRDHLAALERLATPDGTYVPHAGEAWSEADAAHTATLAEQWPRSSLKVFGEQIALWMHRWQLLNAVPREPLGYRLYDTGITGRIHAVEAALQTRAQLILGRWHEETSRMAAARHWGYPLSETAGARPVDPESVHRLLGHLDVPEHVLHGLRIFVLPHSLEGTAGLGGRGRVVLGAAPDARRDSVARTAYTLLHELGHHVHDRYMGAYWPVLSRKWSEYMALRGIDSWAPSGPAGSEAWSRSVQETFAEDFRMLFGPPEARRAPYGTQYGDPRNAPDGGAAVREFIESLF